MLPRTLLISVTIMAMLPDLAPVSCQETFELRVILQLVRRDAATVDARTIVKECTQFLATNGNSHRLAAKVLAARANAYLGLRMWSAAMDDAEEVCRLEPKNPDGFRLRAKAHAGLGDLEKAYASAVEAAKREPSVAKEHAYSAMRTAVRGHPKEARELLDKAAAIEPKNADVYYVRACFFERTDADQCLLAINKFLELNPEGWLDYDNPEDFLEMHGTTLLLLHQPRQALKRFLAARKFRPGGKRAIKLASRLATAYGKIGSFHAALLYAHDMRALSLARSSHIWMSPIIARRSVRPPPRSLRQKRP